MAASERGKPHRAVAGGATDRAVARGQQRAGLAAQPLVGDAAEHDQVEVADAVEHARRAVGAAQHAQHRVGRGGPVEAAVGLFDARARAAPHLRAGIVEPLAAVEAALEVGDDLEQAGDGGRDDVVAIETTLADGAGGKLSRRPDRATVELGVGLQQRHAPAWRVVQDRPVERGGTAVTGRTGMDHDAQDASPDRIRNGAREHGRNDQLRLRLVDGVEHRLVAEGEGDLHVMAALGQLDPGALAQAVVGTGEKQDSH